MKYLFKLSLKNLMRSKRRTILTFTMLTFAVIFYLIMEGSLEGFDKASFQNKIDFETGHFKIRSKQFDEDHPYDVDNYLDNVSVINAKLSKMDFVKGYTSRISFIGEIDNGVDSAPVITIGIDPVNDKKVFILEKYITKGKLEPEGVLVGKPLAKDMNVGLGDQIYITFRDKEGMYTSMDLLITGIVMTADPMINNGAVFINLNEAKEHMGSEGVTEISIKTSDFKEIELYAKRLKSEIDGNVQNWKELSTEFAALMETKRKGSSVFLLFIIIIALVGIINTILMSVYEKRQDIGTLMALGMEHKEVRNMFIFEGFIIGVIGCLMGLLLGTLINLYFIYVGINYTAMMGDTNMGLNVMGHVKSTWVFSAYIKSFLIVVIASVLSSYYPAKKVMKMSPVECLRTVQ